MDHLEGADEAAATDPVYIEGMARTDRSHQHARQRLTVFGQVGSVHIGAARRAAAH